MKALSKIAARAAAGLLAASPLLAQHSPQTPWNEKMGSVWEGLDAGSKADPSGKVVDFSKDVWGAVRIRQARMLRLRSA